MQHYATILKQVGTSLYLYDNQLGYRVGPARPTIPSRHASGWAVNAELDVKRTTLGSSPNCLRTVAGVAATSTLAWEDYATFCPDPQTSRNEITPLNYDNQPGRQPCLDTQVDGW
jgi:hypothetical protein